MHGTSKTKFKAAATRGRLRIFIAVLAALAAATVVAPAAHAASSNPVDFGARVEDRRVVLDSRLIRQDAGFLGKVWVRVEAGIKSTAVVAQPAEFSVESSGLKKGGAARATTSLVAKDGPAKEISATTTPFVNVHAAWLVGPNLCPLDRIKTLEELIVAKPGDCIHGVAHTGDIGIDAATFRLLEADTVFPYVGESKVSNTRSTPTIDVLGLVGLPGILTARLDFVTMMALKATAGYTADRQIVAGGQTVASGAVSWSGPEPQADSFAIPATVPMGASTEYRLSNARWEGQGTLTGAVQLAVEVPILGWKAPPVTVASAVLFDQPIVARAADLNASLGKVGKGDEKDDGDDGDEGEAGDELDCSSVRAVPKLLTPVNGTLRLVTLRGPAGMRITVTGARQDERVSGKGDIGPDAKKARKAHQLYLRAQRDPKGNGRVYSVAFKASKGKESCQGTATLGVPRSKGKAPIKSKLNVDSFKR